MGVKLKRKIMISISIVVLIFANSIKNLFQEQRLNV